MRWSIRYRLLVPMGLLLVAVVGINIWVVLAAAQTTRDRVGRQLRSVSQTLAGSTFPMTPGVLNQMKGLSGVEYLVIRKNQERISTFENPDFEIPPITNPPPEAPGQLGSQVEIRGNRYYCRRLLLPEANPDFGAELYIFYPEPLLREAIWEAIRPPLLVGFLGGLGAIALTIGIAQRMVNRIRELERRTRLIAAGDFSPMPLPKQQDEFRDLSQSVNEMASQLAQLRETVSRTERVRILAQLSTGLAHQLRNAVTGAKLAAQVHAQECPLPDREGLNLLERQLELMDSNLRRLLKLGKSEDSKYIDFSVCAVLEEAISLLSHRCEHAKIELIRKFSSVQANARCDPEQLLDLFLNLVTNAIEAARVGGKVEVRYLEKLEENRIIIEVLDSGPGPVPAVAERLFEPFVTGKPEGIGLGLAVAKRIAEGHQGSLQWTQVDGRTCFRVSLPISTQK